MAHVKAVAEQAERLPGPKGHGRNGADTVAPPSVTTSAPSLGAGTAWTARSALLGRLQVVVP